MLIWLRKIISKEIWISRLALVISLFTLIVSFIALCNSYKQTSLASKQAHQHIEPILKTYFDFPVDKNPVFVIANEGDIPVVSVNVGYRVLNFNKTKEKITFVAEAGRIFSPSAIFREILKPTEYENIELLGSSLHEDDILVYEFMIKYYRQNDMKEFEHTEYIFFDGLNMINHGDFIKNKFYRALMSEISNIMMPESDWNPGTLREYLDVQERNESSQTATPANENISSTP